MTNIRRNELCFYNGKNRIYGELFLPYYGEGSRFPAAILSHGYNSSHEDMTDIAEKLVDSGFMVYIYDFCGGSTRSKSDGSTSEMSVMTEMSDLRAVIDGVCSLKEYDGTLMLYGESQGGFISALTAAELPEKVTALALLYPAFCIPDDWRDRDLSDKPDTFEFMGMEISEKFARELPDYDVTEKMAKCPVPTVIFHGDSDVVVNIKYSEKLFGVMENCELLVYEGEGHGFFPDARDDMTDKAAEFFKKRAGLEND